MGSFVQWSVRIVRAAACGVVAVLVLVSASHGAQGETLRVELAHFAGLVEAADSEFYELYDIDRFAARVGETLTRSEIDGLQAEWLRSRRDTEQRIADLVSDPVALFRLRFEERIGKHPYLQRVTLVDVADYAPFHFLIQPPPKEERNYERRRAAFYGPWFQELLAIFDEEFAGPLGLERRAKYSAFPMVVLHSQGDYKNYSDAIRDRGLHWARAHFEPESRIAVTHEDAFGHSAPARERLRPALHEITHALEHAYYSGEGEGPTEVWFLEGFAEYLSAHLGSTPDALRRHELDLQALDELDRLARSDLRREIYQLPLTDLCEIKSYADAVKAVAARAATHNVYGVNEGLAVSTLYRHSGLLMHFLLHGADGAYRDATLRYIGSVMRGDGSSNALRQAFGDIDPTTVDAAFVEFIDTRSRERYQALYNPHGERPSRDRAAPSDVEFAVDFAALAPEAPETRFALALWTARQGHFSAALAEVDALLPDVADEALRARIRVERERLAEMIAMRLEFLRTAARKLDMRVDGARLLADVARIDGDIVYFEKNVAEIESLGLDDLDPIRLAEMMWSRSYKFERRAMIAYPHLLAGSDEANDVFTKLRDDPVAQRLADDTRDDYPARLALGAASAKLTELAASSEALEANPEEVFAALTDLQREHGSLATVLSRRESLRALGARAMAAVFDRDGLGRGLAAEIEELEGGGVRLRYDFEDPEQLADFAGKSPLFDSSDDLGVESRIAVEDGRLRLFGEMTQQFALELAAPIEIRARVGIDDFPPEGGTFYTGWLLFLCARRSGYVYTGLDGDVTVRDRRTGAARTTDAGAGAQPGVVLELRIVHDGTTVRVFVDGDERGSAKAYSCTEGAILFRTAATLAIEIEELTIEGRPMSDSIRRMRERWIEAELASVGLGAEVPGAADESE
jgi:hypothetical protein